MREQVWVQEEGADVAAGVGARHGSRCRHRRWEQVWVQEVGTVLRAVSERGES